MATHARGASVLTSATDTRSRLAVIHDEPAPVVRHILFGGVVAILLFAPLAFGGVHEWAFAVLETAAAFLFAIWAVSQAASKELEIVSNPLHLPVAVFGLLVLTQIAFGITAYPYATWTEALKYFAYGLLFFITLQCVRTEQQVKHFAWMVTAFGFLYSLFAMAQQFTGTRKVFWLRAVQRGWIYGSYINHNHYAGLIELLLPIPLAFSFYDRLEIPKRVMCGFVAMIMAASIFLSGSRGGMVAFLVESIFFGACFLAQRKGRRPALILAASLVMLFGLIVWLGGDQIAARLAAIQENLQEERSGGRLKIVQDGLRMFLHRPVFGWGLGTFPTVYPQFRSFYTNLFVNEAHNDYLQVLTETGVLGFATVIWFVVMLYRRGLRRLGRESQLSLALRLAALAACTGILAHSFVDFNLHIPANAAWFFVMCALATRPAQPIVKQTPARAEIE